MDFSCWLDTFFTNLSLNPGKKAVLSKDGQISYRELDELSNWFMQAVSEGTRSSFVGIHSVCSPQILAAMIGIHKAGKAYLPIDPKFPVTRRKYMISDSGVDLIITSDETFAGELRENDIDLNIIHAGDSSPIILSEKKQSVPAPGDPAYMLYTSGSTGDPKGVVVSHGALFNFLDSMKEDPGCTSDDVVLSMTTISFDISGLELFLPLFVGGTVQIESSELIYHPEQVIQAILESPVSIVQATPSVWTILLDAGFSGKESLKILCGGDSLGTDLANRLFETGCDIWNMYGPTETTIWSSIHKIDCISEKAVSIGRPIANTAFHILDESLNPVPDGETGQLWISGKGLASGYWNKAGLTEQFFRKLPKVSDLKAYCTGDYANLEEDGTYTFHGRRDLQVKINGIRIELEEIERVLCRIVEIDQAVVIPMEEKSGSKVLIAYIILESGRTKPLLKDLRESLGASLPEYMIPVAYEVLTEVPMTPNRKIDRDALSAMTASDDDIPDVRKAIYTIWTDLLKHDQFSEDDNFFDIGGHSMLLIQMVQRIRNELEVDIDPMTVLRHPSLNSIYRELGYGEKKRIDNISIPENQQNDNNIDEYSLAIIGISCAVPGAENPEEFWNLLEEGRSGLSEFSYDELLEEGISRDLLDNPDYVWKSGSLPSTPYFDHSFFGFSPNEARFMDPQHRLMLEHSHRALESAGIIPGEYEGKIGIYAGAGRNQYLQKNLFFSSEAHTRSDFQTMIGNENDFLASRVAYRLNLTGPALTVQTACSTSLVAVQLAYQSLLTYQCGVAICGGVSLNVPVKSGYLYEEGAILSPDGVCRAFDSKASGTVFGSGVGVVVLKRLPDAVRDKDPIVAVIRSAAINNDGKEKIGYTAPGVKGQTEVVQDALKLAEVSSEMISYVETHGTGTILGDPIEIAGLAGAFKTQNERDTPCFIGSVKTNIGHLDAAAGVIGMIKTSLALKKHLIPPSLNYQTPNPEMMIEKTPFVVNTECRDWKPIEGRWIAGVSSFGIGGTNAHVLLESYETKNPAENKEDLRHLLLPFSARTPEALDRYSDNIRAFVAQSDNTARRNLAYTLVHSRTQFPYRGYLLTSVIGDSVEEASVCPGRVSSRQVQRNPQVVFLLPGQGTEYLNMGLSLCSEDPVFSAYYTQCLDIIAQEADWDPWQVLSHGSVSDTRFTQPLLFSVEWSIARTLQDYGVSCDYLIGHSLGEYTAVCLAGAVSLEDGLKLVIMRGSLMAEADKGQMLAVFSSRDEIEPLVPDDVDIAAVNSSSQVILSGTKDSIQSLESILETHDIRSRPIGSGSAFHSRLMEPVLSQFEDNLQSIDFRATNTKIIGNLMGSIIDSGHVFDSDYWVKHLRNTVLFETGIRKLQDEENLVFIEVGPGSVLNRLVRTIHTESNKNMVQTMATGTGEESEGSFFKKALGALWMSGLTVNFSVIQESGDERVISAPTYPFEKNRHWIDADMETTSAGLKLKSSEISDSDKGIEDTSSGNPVSERLAAIWTRVLGYDSIDPQDNFFDLGGDSLHSADLIRQVNSEFHTVMKLNDVLLNPAFIDMEQRIIQVTQEKEVQDFPILFPVQVSGREPILFLVAGAHENRYYDPKTLESSYEEDFMRYFSSLISYLGPHQTLYGFRPKGIAFSEEAHRDVQEMASEYILELKKIQPVGPYYIGGECVGGIVACEIARQLTEKGDHVAHLLMMDTPRPTTRLLIYEELFYTKQWLKRLYLKYFKGRKSSEILQGIRKSTYEFLYFAFTVSRRQKKTKQIIEGSLYYQRKLLRYHPQKYDGPATLIVNEAWSKARPRLNWNKSLMPGLDVKVVPGNHVTRLSQHGHISGSIIADILKDSTEPHS